MSFWRKPESSRTIKGIIDNVFSAKEYPMTTVLEFNQVKKSYQDHLVLDGINLSVNENEYLALVGINGAGKTSLIKCLLDFALVDSGEIRIYDVAHRETIARKKLSYLPEKFLPSYYLKGREFIQYMLSLYEMEYQEKTVLNMLNTLDLTHESLNKTVGELSKGMAQKLGLAASLLSQRPCLIMDEPMSGLDPKARAYLKQHLLELKKQGQTLFFSTHLLADVSALCDRMAILHNAELKFTGSPDECCEYYKTDDLEQAYLKCIEAE